MGKLLLLACTTRARALPLTPALRLHIRAAAYGGHAAVEDMGLQIFVTLRRGSSWPPAACDVRVRYDQTIGDVKAAVAKKLGVPPEQQQLFWHKKELTAAGYDDRTLLSLNIHTGFNFKGYDLVRTARV